MVQARSRFSLRFRSLRRKSAILQFVVDKNITCAQIENGIREACKYVTDVNLFDVYEGIQLGPDKKEHGILCCIYPAGGRAHGRDGRRICEERF